MNYGTRYLSPNDPEVLVADTLPDLELEPEPEEDELDHDWIMNFVNDAMEMKPGLAVPAWRAWGVVACRLLAVPSLVPTSTGCPPTLDNEGMEKQAVGSTTLATFGAPQGC